MTKAKELKESLNAAIDNLIAAMTKTFEYEGSCRQEQDIWYKRMQNKYGKDHTFFDLSDDEAEEYSVLKKNTRKEYVDSIRL